MTTDDEAYQHAIQVLSPPQALGFDWLINADVQWYSIAEVAQAMGIGRESVRKWCEAGEFPNAINYQPPQIGWRIFRRDLILFFAAMRQNTVKKSAHDKSA